MVHRIVVEDQSLRWYGRPPKIADNSIEFVQFQFHLPEEWASLLIVAQFTQSETYNMLMHDDRCFLPVELKAGICQVSLFGYSEGKPVRATSIPLVFQIEESGFFSSAETPIPPTPDLYTQLIEYFSSIAGSGGGGSGGGTINPEDIAAAVEDYLSKNPPEVPDLSDEVTRAETAASEAEAAADRAEEAAKVTTDLDTTLTQAGKAADAKAVGDAISKLSGGNADQSGLTEYHAGNNLYDPENLVGTHTINGSSVSGLSNWIPVKAKTKYACNKYTQYYFFDTDKNYLSSGTYGGMPVVVTAPQDGFMLINLRGATDVIVVEGTTFGNHYEGYYALRESLTRRVSKADNNSWVGKKWLAIGDSLTDPQYASEGYPYLVSKALGLTLTNVGSSGKVMNYFVGLIPDYADDFDLVTVLLGTNNQGYNCAIGSLNDGVDYTTNNSFYAQTQKLAEVLMAKYPSAVIAFLTPIRRTGVGDKNNNDEGYYINGLGLTTEPYAEAVKEVADYYGLPCLDLYHNGINPKSEWMRQLYFVNSDGTHPNNDGHAKYTAPVIKSFLESLAPFEERIVVEPDIPEPDEPGTDNPEPDNPVITYTVTNTLTNAVNSNSAVSVNKGASYSATIRANSGYELGSVTVTMGGTNITTSAVNGGTITIAGVTGNIVITATATKTEVDSGEAVLVHSYIGTTIPESGGLVDQTGMFDLTNGGGNNYWYSNTEANGSAFALTNGDNASFKFVNAYRNTLYFTNSCSMDTSGKQQWHIGIGDTTGRIGFTPYGYPKDNANGYGDAAVSISYRQDDNADGTTDVTAIASDRLVPKGETHTVTVTVNATDKAVKAYIDGELVIDEVMTVEPRFDGLRVSLNENCPFDCLEIYKGIITDVG